MVPRPASRNLGQGAVNFIVSGVIRGGHSMRKRKVFDGQWGLIGSIFVASLFINLLILTAPLYMLQLFSRVMSSGSMSTLAVLTIGAAIALTFYFLFDALRQKLLSRFGTRLEASLGPTVLTVLVESASATDRRGGQPLLDLHELRRFVTGPSFTALLDAPWAVVFVAIIFIFHFWLGFVALTGILILLALGIISEISGRTPSARAAEASQKANASVEEMIRNADIVRAMGKTPAQIDRWKHHSFGSMVASTEAVDRVALMSSFARLVRMALQIAMLGTGVILVLRGELSPGLMIAASILLGRAAAPVEQSISGWRAMIAARQATDRLNRLLGNIEEAGRPIELPEPEGRLSVENATIVVPGRQDPIIFDVTFDLKPGDTMGIIGSSGAGKTTLGRALVGLTPLSRGYVRIDDAALADWPVDQIGRHIGYLPQRVELFDGSIAENIAMMDADAAPSEVVEAAKRAEVHELILKLPGGYNAEVGLRGELLSAGQRQRIGLARAFYGDKRLIVLDEPNANLDPDGEEALARAMKNAADAGAVVIIITHRMNILRQVTHAGLMQNGRMSKFGKARDIFDAVAQPMASQNGAKDPKVTVLSQTSRAGPQKRDQNNLGAAK